MNLKIELHAHSSASDGEESPSSLVDLAYARGIKVLALTDHDTTLGLEEAIKRAADYNMTIIPGIELSSKYKEETIHVLGYFKDKSYCSLDFQRHLRELRDYREYRAKKIIENLNTYFNIKISYEHIAQKNLGVIGRPHIARAIIEAGYPYSFDFIFKNIINKESKAYVHNKHIPLQENIDLLINHNALAVLAHPVLIKKVPFEEVAGFNFQGLEVYYNRNSIEDTNRYLGYARKKGLLVCGGSDFHSIRDKKHGGLGEVSPLPEDVNSFLKHMHIKI